MIVLVLSAVAIGLAILERIIYIKGDGKWQGIRLFLGILIAFSLLIISYFITDTTIGMSYVFSSAVLMLMLGISNHRNGKKESNYLPYLYIIGLPSMTYLLIKATQNMLTSPHFIFLLITIINWILGYSYKWTGTTKANISFVLGIIFAAALIFSYPKLSPSGEEIMLRHEAVAQRYLEELGIYGAHAYGNRKVIKLRGQEILIKAYDSSDTLIIMTYKDGKIINHSLIPG